MGCLRRGLAKSRTVACTPVNHIKQVCQQLVGARSSCNLQLQQIALAPRLNPRACYMGPISHNHQLILQDMCTIQLLRPEIGLYILGQA